MSSDTSREAGQLPPNESTSDPWLDTARRVAMGRGFVNLDNVDFGSIVALAEPLLATACELAEWETDGWIGDAGGEMLLKFGDQWSALESALAAAGMADRNTAWLSSDPRKTSAARCLRDLACDLRRGRLPGAPAVEIEMLDGGTSLIPEVKRPEITLALLAKRLGVAVKRLRELAAAPPPCGRASERPTADETAYLPMKDFLDGDFPTYKAIHKALAENPWIHTRLRKTKDGQDDPRRPMIHAANWKRLKDARKGADPLDLADAVAAVEERKEEARRLKEQGRK